MEVVFLSGDIAVVRHLVYVTPMHEPDPLKLRPPERYFAWMKYFKIIIITYKISIIWNRHLVVYIEHGIDIFVIDYYLNLC